MEDNFQELCEIVFPGDANAYVNGDVFDPFPSQWTIGSPELQPVSRRRNTSFCNEDESVLSTQPNDFAELEYIFATQPHESLREINEEGPSLISNVGYSMVDDDDNEFDFCSVFAEMPPPLGW